MSSLAEAWERRYAEGGDSGAGSRGENALRKAAYVNALLERERIASVIDWGCGDGQQLALLSLPESYLGIDISPTAVGLCMVRFPKRRFVVASPPDLAGLGLRAELSLSMDVIFHLVADADFRAYVRAVFGSAERFVCIHSTDENRLSHKHMRHRQWTPYVAERYPQWRLVDRTSTTGEGFFLYQRIA